MPQRKSEHGRGFGKAFLSRRLEVATEPPTSVLVRFSQPSWKDRSMWECRYEIKGLGQRTLKTAYGVDSVQAISLAIEGARKWLHEQHLVFGGTFASDPYGLPRQLLFVLGRDENTELAALVDKEIEAFAERFLKMSRSRRLRQARERTGGPS